MNEERAEELCPVCGTYKAGQYPPYHCDVCRCIVPPRDPGKDPGQIRDDAPPYIPRRFE